ncbi:MAG TPA: DoxX family protein [Thermoanaerobaculia bacterium]|nr:DoxX family protein [Thermoanaerobaculia bacterium]
MAAGNDPRRPALNYVLWTLQVLLAALFLFAGAMKFIMPVAEMTKQMPLPAWFLWFIGAAEFLGGLGLVLPSLLRIRPGLTPLAAAGLAIIMIGATVVSVQTGGVKAGLFPFVVGLLLAFVAYGRWRLWPIAAKS